ncbi:hypothetical protein KIH27_10285 [Mycobacterium sp. M1]|uniref:Uncharacterized protein n=1 Tax=Mycolicibacter acidiphilus TaxID=2835306 RepID=A0ABS5RI43_9MYCO|nr:hypothetical protein [Mycolicibacter acidiphilus]MBS9533971.1 hypothetical protein [Mycolicibacter acidiphilus]
MKRNFACMSAIGIGAALAIVGAGVADASEGGITPDVGGKISHTWVKVGRVELNQKGAQAACLGYWGCDGLISELNMQKGRNPKANGYWAEKYYNVKNFETIRLRSGTW